VFGAEEALTAGLISELVDQEQLLPRARAIARDIVEQTAPVSIALIRQMMWRGLGMDHPMEAHKVDSRGIYARGASADVREGVSSFLEKRPPQFPEKVSTGMPRYFPWWPARKYS
jgi:enoyl-CoA hydratase/carnithine racemase